ncbi:MAG TPA: hypothetical protein VMB51_04795 [Solirubrobacteraceae bacterium]|nr:hypothetical protein [Solirubrobacteraceae bacterium]
MRTHLSYVNILALLALLFLCLATGLADAHGRGCEVAPGETVLARTATGIVTRRKHMGRPESIYTRTTYVYFACLAAVGDHIVVARGEIEFEGAMLLSAPHLNGSRLTFVYTEGNRYEGTVHTKVEQLDLRNDRPVWTVEYPAPIKTETRWTSADEGEPDLVTDAAGTAAWAVRQRAPECTTQGAEVAVVIRDRQRLKTVASFQDPAGCKTVAIEKLAFVGRSLTWKRQGSSYRVALKAGE